MRSLWAKVCLTLLTLPIAMFTNAVRIVTLWSLATKVDIGFLYGNLHHNGGILFSLIALSILLGCLYLLRMLEGRENKPHGERWESPSATAAEIAKP
jgi:exosortase/archaeosortase family protein